MSIVYRLRSKVWPHKFETVDPASAMRKLTEVKKVDPQAKIISVQSTR